MANETEIRNAWEVENVAAFAGADSLNVKGGLWDGRYRHALAALALHDQSFGFTRDDVALLNWHASMQHSVGLYINEDRLRSIADRIAALLPPNDHG